MLAEKVHVSTMSVIWTVPSKALLSHFSCQPHIQPHVQPHAQQKGLAVVSSDSVLVLRQHPETRFGRRACCRSDPPDTESDENNLMLKYKSEVEVSSNGDTIVDIKEVQTFNDPYTGHLEFDSQDKAVEFFSGIIEEVLQGDPQDYLSGQKQFIDTLIRHLLDDPRSLSDKKCREEMIEFLKDNHNLMETKTKRDRLHALGFQHAMDMLIALTRKDL